MTDRAMTAPGVPRATQFPEPVYLAWSEYDSSATVKGWGGSDLYSCRECGDGFRNQEEQEAAVHSALHQRAEAAASGLDVERLARAMLAQGYIDITDGRSYAAARRGTIPSDYRHLARRIAAEYARLAQEEGA